MSSSCSRPRAGKDAGEDSWLAEDADGVYALADGMGGYEFGKEASTLVVDTLRSVLSREDPARVLPNAERLGESELQKAFLSHALGKANVALCKLGSEREAPVGSTGTVIRLGRDRLWGAHVGDCRALLFDEQFAVRQLTRDHRPAGRAGSNRLERSLGYSLNVACDTFEEGLPRCYGLLLCCDGVWEHAPDRRLRDIVRETPAEQVAGAIVAEAVANESDDDVTAVYVESIAMSELKEVLRIQRLEAEVSAGSREAAALECLLDYFLRQQNSQKVSDYLELYVAPETGRPADEPLVGRGLDLLRERDAASYSRRLRDLHRAEWLPAGRLADLAASYREADDLGPEAYAVYSARLSQDGRDYQTRAYRGLCRLQQERAARAEADLSQALADGDVPFRERILSLLATRFGRAGRDLGLRLAVTLQHPGVAKNLIAQLDEAAHVKDDELAGKCAVLLGEIARTYEHGREDWQAACAKLEALNERRESKRLQEELAREREQKTQELAREREQKAELHRQVREEHAEKDRLSQDLAQVRNELLLARQEIDRKSKELNEALTDQRNRTKKVSAERDQWRSKYEKLRERAASLLDEDADQFGVPRVLAPLPRQAPRYLDGCLKTAARAILLLLAGWGLISLALILAQRVPAWMDETSASSPATEPVPPQGQASNARGILGEKKSSGASIQADVSSEPPADKTAEKQNSPPDQKKGGPGAGQPAAEQVGTKETPKDAASLGPTRSAPPAGAFGTPAAQAPSAPPKSLSD